MVTDSGSQSSTTVLPIRTRSLALEVEVSVSVWFSLKGVEMGMGNEARALSEILIHLQGLDFVSPAGLLVVFQGNNARTWHPAP